MVTLNAASSPSLHRGPMPPVLATLDVPVGEHLLNRLHVLSEYLLGPEPDPRVMGWLLVDPVSPVLLTLLYLLSVPLGMAIMRNREALKLKTLTALHNVLLFALSFYMCVETFRQVGTSYAYRLSWRADDTCHARPCVP
jgi:hypothetical protein